MWKAAFGFLGKFNRDNLIFIPLNAIAFVEIKDSTCIQRELFNYLEISLKKSQSKSGNIRYF